MSAPTPPTLEAIALPSGAFAMVAMDQRESLRTMFDAAGAGRPADEVLIRFKRDVAAVLGPLASGFLIDRHLGFSHVRDFISTLPRPAGLILAADALRQAEGGPVEETELDEAVLSPDFDLAGVAALKLLIIWRRDGRRGGRVQLAKNFIAAARERALLSVLEPVVHATEAELAAGTWDPEEAIREAARELSPLGPSLYKVQVPLGGRGTAQDQLAASRELARSISGPWVVLSQGVGREDFAAAVEAACRSGASGFLAGRALWSDVVGSADVPAALRAVSVPRFERLLGIVNRYARPWRDA